MIKDATCALRKLLLWTLGGKGGQGGRGVKCDLGSSYMREFGTEYFCEGEYTERARKGDTGENGAAGSSKIILIRFNIVS